MILAKFRQYYPQGSLVSELVDIDRGTYIVRVSIIVNKIVLTTGLAGANKVEIAEDIARERAIAALMLDNYETTNQSEASRSISSDQSQNPTLTTTPQKIPSTQTAPVNSVSSPSPPNKTGSYHSLEDNNVANIADYSEKKENQSDSNVFTPLEKQKLSVAKPTTSLEPETKITTSDDGTVKQAKIDTDNQAVPNSANLFEGTSNSDMAFNKVVPDNPHIAPETVPASIGIDRASSTLEEVNFNEIKHQTDLEIKRLGWTKNDGREFLKSRYGKRSRLHLTDSQLLEFLQYLASQPNPS